MKNFLFPAILPLIAASCVSYTKTEDEKPLTLKFSSQEAAQTFYEGILLQDQKPITQDNDQSVNVRLGLSAPVSWGKVDTPQKRLNAAFREADQNGNGTVSLREAQAFATSLKEKSS